MSDEQAPANGDTITEEPSEGEGEGEGSAEIRDAGKPESAASPATPEEQVKDLFERLQRVSADYQNYQKRVQRDKAKWSQDSVRSLLSSLLPVLDNLDSAIAAFDGDVKDPDALKQGVLMIREGFTRQLNSFKLVRIQAEPGTPFDPDDHEAIMVQPDEDAERREVLFQARAGYRLGDTVLRPAQVGVRQPPAS